MGTPSSLARFFGLREVFSRWTSSARFRLRRRHLGLTAARDLPFSLDAHIAGRNVALGFPPEERPVFAHEFHKILVEDCYGLARLRGKIGTVVDIGANLGLFSLAARERFPQAKIHAYEPNQLVETYLRSNLQSFQIQTHLEAIGSTPGRARLHHRENSLHTVSVPDIDGDVPQVTLEHAITRLGGKVDLLKLDCEGAEWSLLNSTDVWQKVGHLTMEYHLWAKPSSRLDDLTAILQQLGFTRIKTFPGNDPSFGILWADRG